MAAFLVAGCVTHHHEAAEVTYESAYLRPLASPGGKFGALPLAVQNTIRAEAGSAEIRDIATINRLGELSYEIYFRNEDILPPLLIAANGSVLNPDFSVAVSALAVLTLFLHGSILLPNARKRFNFLRQTDNFSPLGGYLR